MSRDDIIRMAQEAGFYIDQDWIEHGLPGFERFAELVRADEREACAKLCDDLAEVHEQKNQWNSHKTADALAQAIRARGEK